eukprot:g13500.t1
MDAGADGSAGYRGFHGRTLLGAAACGKSAEMVQALLNAGARDDVKVKFGSNQESALHVAATRGAETVATMLVLAGADPNVLDGCAESSLHQAAGAGHDGVVNNLLLTGANPNVRRLRENQTPLHLAAVKGHAPCVSKLVVGGADKESRDEFGYSPLHLAVQNNRLEAVEELLAAGVSVDVRAHDDGCSALDMAAHLGDVDVVRALLRHGSSVGESDDDGFTALHRAAEVDDPDRDNGDVIRVLLEAGADIEAKTIRDGCTPLHLAAFGRMASSATICALLEGDANVNARSTGESTPLHDACFRSNFGAVELLLRWGADEELTNDNGERAEDILGKWGRHGRLDSYTDQREADDRRIWDMLARAPADRSWRRRGWLVLTRSCPTKVQLMQKCNRDGAGDGSGCDGAGSCVDVDGNGNGTGDFTRTDLVRLVGRVVGLDVEGIFRLVVGFL